MYLLENVNLALAGLKSNKMRALLTMLGIIIGISSVIAIVTVGNSLTNSITSSMQDLGATNIYAMLQEKDRGMGMVHTAPKIDETDLITDDMLKRCQELYKSEIETISVEHSAGSGKVQDNRLYANINVTGINEGYVKANNVEIIKGRNINESDLKANRYTAVVSDKLVKNIFKKGENPIGREIKATIGQQGHTFNIVGVYKYVDNMMMGGGASRGPEKDRYTNMYIPITTAQIISSSDRGYQYAIIMAKSGLDNNKFSEKIKKFFNTYYDNNPKYQIDVINMESQMEIMTTMLGTISTAIAVIAAISLLVGGIGVMNIMLVSVTERTREIGTRKALGAKNASIRAQFIVEAVIICAIGGIIGIISGIGLGYLGAKLLGFPAAPSIAIIIIAVLFSMLIGVFFGYYPANKAARLDPIEALRYE